MWIDSKVWQWGRSLIDDLEKNLEDVSLIIATFNEEESIAYVLDELQNFHVGEIIIIDGNSTDNTETIVKEYDVIFETQRNQGWGSAVKEGISLSTKKYIAYMDGDGSYNPKALPIMRSLLNEYDAVLCSRYKDGAKSPDDTFIRSIGNKLFTYIVCKIFGPKITDSLFFYPMLEKEKYENLNLTSSDFTLCLELPVLIHKNNLKYIEILSEERERYAGITKVNAFYDGLKILTGILRLIGKKWNYI